MHRHNCQRSDKPSATSRLPQCPLVTPTPECGSSRCAKNSRQQAFRLFNHLVGAAQQRQRNIHSERLRGLEIDEAKSPSIRLAFYEITSSHRTGPQPRLKLSELARDCSQNDRQMTGRPSANLFDNVIGTSQHAAWNFDPRRPGGLYVYYQLVLCWSLHRQVGRLLTLQDAVHIGCASTE